jgi:hypothetical protein
LTVGATVKDGAESGSAGDLNADGADVFLDVDAVDYEEADEMASHDDDAGDVFNDSVDTADVDEAGKADIDSDDELDSWDNVIYSYDGCSNGPSERPAKSDNDIAWRHNLASDDLSKVSAGLDVCN